MSSQKWRKSGLCVAMGICLASMASWQPAFAANNDGSLAGRVAAGSEVTVHNADTGFTRTVRADAEGNYRFPFLPVGNYTLRASKDGQAVGEPIEVVVSLGNATNVNLGQATNLAAVQVIGTRFITPVDVKSTESATNVTREDLARLPVERDPISVALLAPGLTKGDSDLGGISFGGSSVAENSVYINGLNVTDFYNRVGFSSVPFSFYKEFQVKTGGYSVEFGRTTGGVINAVTRSGTNEFDYGAEFVWEPHSLQSKARDHYDANGNRYYTASHDEFDRSSLNVFASGPIVKDKLFFFAMYEARDYEPTNTNTPGTSLFKHKSDDGFWGAKLDWQINDSNLLELLAFSDKNDEVVDVYRFNANTGVRGNREDVQYIESGGKNYALTYTGYLTDTLSMKAMYGKNERNRATNSLNDINCNRVFDNRPAPLEGDYGCTSSALVEEAVDDRKAMRLDFEWSLGDHLLRFGVDREENTSDYRRYYPGPGTLRYDIFEAKPGDTLENGGVVPAGTNAYVRSRKLSVDGVFETINSAYYLEDNWSVTPNVMLNLGLRMEAFDNKNAEGRSYIKIDDMLAPRLGVSWDMNGDGRTKVFANVGRYFLPVANVINIKQGGGFLDERTFYVFDGYQTLTNNGESYQMPILGQQIGGVDNSQGDGTVRDLRGKVDKDMDPVYQDELIVGFQSMIDDKWSWGVRGIYRKLHNAIDDMNVTSNGIVCNGKPGKPGFVMGNPGKVLTLYTDTNCDGINDAYVDIDTSRAGWAMFDSSGKYLGDRGWDRPKRTYRALEFVFDRAWDEKWAFNASYTWSQSEGNAEGPVTSDFNFADAGRTEAFDNPWVNINGYGYLPNDRRHQIKMRGTYAINDHWQIGATLNAQSGRPISAMGVGNPFDGTNFHSFYVCVSNCTAPRFEDRVYQLHRRGTAGRTPWTYDVGASLTYSKSFARADLQVKLAVYNLFNQQRTLQVDEDLQTRISNSLNPTFLREVGFQSPRYGQLTVSLNF